ncbi:Rha family transcriptional regulator [Edwardsiella piscicida]|uniref:Rha family transcriptional regulator n=1 Tax=Edwardsiella piscicida TaxID=1263550 RepID=UPI00197ACB2D|nr:Rha family transcriptional regulator [Edwardsiella piscicida]EKS7767182.1 Rha family transcriptional regulator [Edwardsiella piscicida]UCQ29756.1 Rha family transcriptional regulator [Edwardsiella piscicida]WGS75573.1 Rha family transcriptional regulator [Edwardsiella piscicida]WGS78962.1 Rha family transcriptional regulator [Edwardsiella piscicida]
MNNLISSDAITMSSREIAELTGKQHGHIKRDIEGMLQDLGEDVSSFGYIYFDSCNRRQKEYRLDRRHVDCLLAGYSAVLRMKVIDRWHELERASSRPVPHTYLQALECLVESERKKQKLEIVMQQTTLYYDCLRVIKANPGTSIKAQSCWRPLKKWCESKGVPIKRVFCPRFGEVNAYPREAWLAVYPDHTLPNEASKLIEMESAA